MWQNVCHAVLFSLCPLICVHGQKGASMCVPEDTQGHTAVEMCTYVELLLHLPSCLGQRGTQVYTMQEEHVYAGEHTCARKPAVAPRSMHGHGQQYCPVETCLQDRDIGQGTGEGLMCRHAHTSLPMYVSSIPPPPPAPPAVFYKEMLCGGVGEGLHWGQCSRQLVPQSLPHSQGRL